MAVGTHALFQDDVAFHALALTVIDEQHRFGVSERGRLQDAVSEFEAAVRLSPGFAEAHFGLGISLAMSGGHREEAIGQLEKALELRPDFELARRALGRLKATRP